MITIPFYRFEECPDCDTVYHIMYPDGIYILDQTGECPDCHQMTSVPTTDMLATAN